MLIRLVLGMVGGVVVMVKVVRAVGVVGEVLGLVGEVMLCNVGWYI